MKQEIASFVRGLLLVKNDKNIDIERIDEIIEELFSMLKDLELEVEESLLKDIKDENM